MASEAGLLLGRRGRLKEPDAPFGFVNHPPEPAPADDSLIRYDGEAPLITMAPTGAGKSSGPVICNLMNHPGQVICLDVKGKVYEVTEGHRRRMGQEVYVLDLRDNARGHGALNPLDIAKKLGTETTSTARAFAAEIVQRTGKERESFWNSWAESMVTAGMAYLWDILPEDEQRLSRLYDLYMSSDADYSIACLLDKHGSSMGKATYGTWGAYLQLPDRETRPSVLASTTEFLRLYESDLVRRLTDTTSIDLDGLVAGKPMSIYITVPPHRIAAYAPLLRLWITGLMNLLTTREQAPEHRTLMLVDEAGQLGRLDGLLTASTLMREYGLTIWTFWQNAAQLEVYGPQARTLIDNAGAFQCFGLRNLRMAQEIAMLIGGISAEQLLGMGADEQLLAVGGKPPQIARQIRHYREPWLAGAAPTR